MFGANSFASFYWGQIYPVIVPYVPPPPPPEFEEQLGVLVRHICVTPSDMGVDSMQVCGTPSFAVESASRCAPGDIGVTASIRCTVPLTPILSQRRTQRSTRWPITTTRR